MTCATEPRCLTTLMAHQREAVAKLLPTRVGALFMDMGTGKSRTAIELARLRRAKIDRVVWCCPVSLKTTIAHEINKHIGGWGGVYVFDDRTTERTVDRRARWVIVGLESVSGSCRVTLALASLIDERTMVVVDESSYIKGHRAKRTERLTLLADKARYRLILTGTPLTQGVIDLFAQMRFLSPRILGYRSWYSFRANHLEYSDKFRGMIVRSHNQDYLAAKMRPYVYQVTKDECLDLPDKHYANRYFSMTGEQQEYYSQAKYDLLNDLTLEDWDALNIFRLFTALQSIVCGFVRYTLADGRTVEADNISHRRVDALATVISEVPPPEKVIVWAKYRHALRQITDRLRADYGEESTAQFYGDLSERQREHELQRFRSEARFLVATQSSGGHGLNLTEATTVVFYANSFKYSERVQSEDRCHRIGQSRKVLYVDLVCLNSIDSRIDAAIAGKGNALTAFRAEIEKIKAQKQGKKKLRQLVESL